MAILFVSLAPLAASDGLPKKKQLHELTLSEFSRWLENRSRSGEVRNDIGGAIAAIAEQSSGTPFRLGAPIFDTGSADCVTHVERCIAASCTSTWEQFYFGTLRLRHKDRSLDFLDRNFFPLTDWIPNNAWLLQDVTDTLGVEPVQFEYVVRPKTFLEKLEFGEDDTLRGRAKAAAKAERIAAAPEKLIHSDSYLPVDGIPTARNALQPGDIWFSVVKREAPEQRPWYDSNHMGVVVSAGENLRISHATTPMVLVEQIDDFVAIRPEVVGFKFLRVRANALAIVAEEVEHMRLSLGLLGQAPSPHESEVQSTQLLQVTTTRSSDCYLQEIETIGGAGCCDIGSTPVCDLKTYSYDANCVGDCSPGQTCRVVRLATVLVYQYQDCYGECPIDCIINPDENHNYSVFATEPTRCLCLK